MTEEEKLALGIEIVAAMKASVYGLDIEDGRILALENTETDRIEGMTSEEWEQLPAVRREIKIRMVNAEREALHKQAMFVAEATLKHLGL